MRGKIFIDTSGWLAYILKGESSHEAVKTIITKYIQEGRTICTSSDVIDETVTRLVYATNPSIVARFISYIEKSITAKKLVQFWPDEQTQTDAWEIVQKYADQKLSLTDATTIVFYRRYTIETIVTLDSDFFHLGFTTVPK